MTPVEFSQQEIEVLRIVQADLPDSQSPFADIASRVGLSENEVLDLLRGLKERGIIRRFGATLRHQQAGYGHNAMVAWYVEQDQDISHIGRTMSNRPEITHCYQRINCMDWPYNLYTMVHGRSPEHCCRVVQELAGETGVNQFEMLFSYRELKKTSMRYF
ncbi:Lrp/AsnC family transcriptional regulator [Desulfonatronospira sp.]|uniref:siroheme decarboxylase subunit beta n=1 Tax=Desulfonatronospira sp. TaxID=1962951 RepID=UPI0025C4EFD3|nr:Lrp/AsnC family transcriptional regulator [Desulfonatronospira sp.]